MSKMHKKMGPHDVGGENAIPIDLNDPEMTHWEKYANALRIVVSSKRIITLDELRYHTEKLGDAYFEIGYFEFLQALSNLASFLIPFCLFGYRKISASGQILFTTGWTKRWALKVAYLKCFDMIVLTSTIMMPQLLCYHAVVVGHSL